MLKAYASKLAAIGIIALASSGRVEAEDSFREFLVVYRCDVLERLKLVYATGDPAQPLNRYIAISTPTHDYVQCIFHDRNRRVRCEASSGFWKTKRGRERTAYQKPQTIAALAKLGFDTDDSAGNFGIDRPVSAPAVFAPLADLMLRALHDGYGARSDTKLIVNAPFAPDRPAACVPVS